MELIRSCSCRASNYLKLAHKVDIKVVLIELNWLCEGSNGGLL